MSCLNVKDVHMGNRVQVPQTCAADIKGTLLTVPLRQRLNILHDI